MRPTHMSALTSLLAGLMLAGCGGVEESGTVPAEQQTAALAEQNSALTSPTVSLSCSRVSSLDVSCTGSVSGGAAPYDALWLQRIFYMDRIYSQGWREGGLTRTFNCIEPYPGGLPYVLTAHFRVTDAGGVSSNTVTSSFDCSF